MIIRPKGRCDRHDGVGDGDVSGGNVVQHDHKSHRRVAAIRTFCDGGTTHRTLRNVTRQDGAARATALLTWREHGDAYADRRWRSSGEHTCGRHGEHDIGSGKGVVIGQWAHTFTHAQQSHDAAVVLACGTACGTGRCGFKLGIQIATPLQSLDDGVGRGGREGAVLRGRSLVGFGNALVELEGVLWGNRHGLTIEQLELDMPARCGLDDFVFFNGVACTNGADLSIHTDGKGFSGNGDDGSKLGHVLSPEIVAECDDFRLERPRRFCYWT